MSREGGSSEPGARTRLYRIPSRGVLFGVCAGIADYFGFDLTATRVLVVIAAFFSFPLVILAYLALAMLLPRTGPADRSEAEPVDPVRRSVRSSPHEILSDVRYRFNDLDLRLQRLEKYVTSSRFMLDREFERLREKS